MDAMNNGLVAVAASLHRRAEQANRELGMALLQVAAGEEKAGDPGPWERIIVSCHGCCRRDERWNTCGRRERTIDHRWLLQQGAMREMVPFFFGM